VFTQTVTLEGRQQLLLSESVQRVVEALVDGRRRPAFRRAHFTRTLHLKSQEHIHATANTLNIPLKIKKKEEKEKEF
jgi:hypothetical protein